MRKREFNLINLDHESIRFICISNSSSISSFFLSSYSLSISNFFLTFSGVSSGTSKDEYELRKKLEMEKEFKMRDAIYKLNAIKCAACSMHGSIRSWCVSSASFNQSKEEEKYHRKVCITLSMLH